MIRFIQHFLRAWRDAALLYAYDPLADSEEFWTEEDAQYLTQFFSSNTGQRLKTRLTNYVVRSAIDATRQSDGLTYHAGVARGIALGVVALETHFTARSPRSVNLPEVLQPKDAAADFALN